MRRPVFYEVVRTLRGIVILASKRPSLLVHEIIRRRGEPLACKTRLTDARSLANRLRPAGDAPLICLDGVAA